MPHNKATMLYIIFSVFCLMVMTLTIYLTCVNSTKDSIGCMQRGGKWQIIGLDKESGQIIDVYGCVEKRQLTTC